MIIQYFKIKVKNVLVVFVMSCLPLVSTSLFAQSRMPKTQYDGLFKEVYYVSEVDTAMRHGICKLYYKGKVIERGRYANNLRVGRWRYFSLNGIFEYEYNFDANELVAISGKPYQELKKQTPCLYQGSPLIPYLYLVTNLSYPSKAKDKDIQGKVVLALKVNVEGEVYGFYLAEKLHPIIDKAVMDVAKTIPDDWDFLCATRMGQRIPSEYFITIEFELE